MNCIQVTDWNVAGLGLSLLPEHISCEKYLAEDCLEEKSVVLINTQKIKQTRLIVE